MKNGAVLETDRLRLRPMRRTDAAFLRDLMNEPAYLAHIGDRGVRTVEAAAHYLEQKYVASYARHGYGLYIVEQKIGESPLGICGLVKRDELDAPDLGFAFGQAHWSQGYAFEATAATLEWARGDDGFERCYAIVSPQNARSIRLLEKLGLHYARMLRLPTSATELQLYTLHFNRPAQRVRL